MLHALQTILDIRYLRVLLVTRLKYFRRVRRGMRAIAHLILQSLSLQHWHNFIFTIWVIFVDLPVSFTCSD